MTQNDFTHTAFQEHLAQHKLMASRCLDCGETFLPPRPLCAHCFGDQMEWIEVDGQGELLAFTTIHIAPTAMIEAGYGRDNPYCSGIVRLKDGLTISAQITGVDAANPESIKIGAPVSVDFIERGESEAQKTFLAFKVKE